ncbi:MAG: sugar transferase [Gemmatimonadaceae bacterium]
MPAYRGKRLFDLLITLLTMPIWLPLLTVLAVLVLWRLGLPIFFVQQRPGFAGRPFRLIKFRTMSMERDERGASLPDDQRLPRFGRLLRATSLDELPEFINVLLGQMSLVGPRPLLVEYLPLYSPEHACRHEVRPGITGWAQVNGRNMSTWETRLGQDVWYVNHASFRLDVEILARTLLDVVRRRGIHEPGQATMTRFTGSKRIN